MVSSKATNSYNSQNWEDSECPDVHGAAAIPTLEPPEDKSITTLCIGGLEDDLTEGQLRDHFNQYGEIGSVTMVPHQQCAYIQYTQRSAAELAVEQTFNQLILEGRQLTIKWDCFQGRQTTSAEEISSELLELASGLRKPLPPAESVANNFCNLQTTPEIMTPLMVLATVATFKPESMTPLMTLATVAASIITPGTTSILFSSQET